MKLTANLKDGYNNRTITVNLPEINSPFLPITYVDPRWARPYVFQNFGSYTFSETVDVRSDFNRLVELVNTCTSYSTIERFKAGLLKLVDEHISRCGRLLFVDMLMYIDCLAYLCYASDLFSESQIVSQYASWAKFIIDKRKASIYASTNWGVISFSGSQNERDLNSCF